jgi:hypothetical protein
VAGGLRARAATAWLRTDRLGNLHQVALDRPSAVEWTGAGAPPELVPRDGWHVWRRAEAAS